MDYQRLFQVLPKTPVKWNVKDVELWLKFIDLHKLFNQFSELSIDGSCINSLTEEDLRTQLHITSGIIIKKIMQWINRGLKQYTDFINTRVQDSNLSLLNMTKNAQQINSKAPKCNPLKEISQKQKNKQKTIKVDYSKQEKNRLGSDIVGGKLGNDVVGGKLQTDEQNELINNLMIDEDEQNTKKQYQLIINQADGPQTSFFSVKEQGAKIGRHSSNQILILDQSISRYHAEIKFQANNFYLKDIGSTTGTFIRIQGRKEIYHKMIIQMGSNQFMANLAATMLHLNVIQGPAQNTMVQIPKHNKITIGRKSNNLLNFPDDQHLSNMHSALSYSDGKYYIEDLGTTNGTWQRLSQETQQSQLHLLNEKTVFKIGSNQIYVCRIKTSMVSQRVHPNACVICCEQQKDCVYMPCKHNTACIRCSKNLKECPICRMRIDDYVRIYKS